jgi:Transposase DDE domain
MTKGAQNMSSCDELYNRLMQTVQPLVRVSNRKQLANWMWIVVGILQANAIALSCIATHLPQAVLAESRVTLIRRWLMNFHVDVWAFYQPILAKVLAGWEAASVYIVLDGVMVFGNHWQVFRLSLVHGCRAIPLVWTVVPGKGLTKVERLEAMLTQAAQFLRPRVNHIVFLADRGFRDCDWAKLCQKLRWDYVIRVQSNTFVTLRTGHTCHITELKVMPAQRRYFQNIWLTQAAKWCANLTVTWSAGDDQHPPEILAVISSQPASRARLREYALRMQIEQSFRDDKSSGFDLAHTRLQHADRVERLLLAVAVATLWCHELGEHVLSEGEDLRREIDPGFARELSLFQLGLRWLQRCLSVTLSRLPPFRARLSPLKLSPGINLVKS